MPIPMSPSVKLFLFTARFQGLPTDDMMGIILLFH